MYKRNKRSSRRSKLSKRLKQSSKRSSKRRHTRKNNRRHTRRKGGNYMQQTERTLEGIPVEKGTVVTVPGFGTMSVKEYIQYVNNHDSHPRS